VLLSVLLPVLAIPAGWPHHLAIGLSDPPGDAHRLAARAHLDARYQYLAGGVNTGTGWATWNPGGSFAALYVRESIQAKQIPVLTYYQMLQSRPAAGHTELAKDVSNLRNGSTMRAYWADFRLLLRRVAEAAGGRLVVIHVEPDLWGYLELAHETTLARTFARRLVGVRNRFAPNVLLAWHLSSWGTNQDVTASSQADALGVKSADFYTSLATPFDLVFTDVADRDAGFYQRVEGNARRWWGPTQFRRENQYLRAFTSQTHAPVVLWQLPLGNTTLNDTWRRYRDNRVQWWLGADRRPHLRATRDAGVVGMMFGGGGDGTTSADTDGGLFYRVAGRYEANPVALR
jgi:hypothetical protein